MAISAGEGERGAGVNSEGQGEKRGFRVVSRGDPEVMKEGGKVRHELGAHQPEGGTVEQGMAHIGWRGSGCPRPGGEIRAKVAMSVRVGAVAAEGGAEVAMRRKKGALTSELEEGECGKVGGEPKVEGWAKEVGPGEVGAAKGRIGLNTREGVGHGRAQAVVEALFPKARDDGAEEACIGALAVVRRAVAQDVSGEVGVGEIARPAQSEQAAAHVGLHGVRV